MELQLDRNLSNKRIFPAVNITASSTRRETCYLTKQLLTVCGYYVNTLQI